MFHYLRTSDGKNEQDKKRKSEKSCLSKNLNKSTQVTLEKVKEKLIFFFIKPDVVKGKKVKNKLKKEVKKTDCLLETTDSL